MRTYTIKYKDEILVEGVRAVDWYREYHIGVKTEILNDDGTEILLILKRFPSCISLSASGYIHIYKKYMPSPWGEIYGGTGLKILWESEKHLQERVLDKISS